MRKKIPQEKKNQIEFMGNGFDQYEDKIKIEDNVNVADLKPSGTLKQKDSTKAE